MEKQQRIEKVSSWLRDVTGLEKQAENTVGWLISKATEDPTCLARAGRKVWQAIHDVLPDGSKPLSLRNLPSPLHKLYSDQPDQMQMYPLWKNVFGVEDTIAHVGNFFEHSSGGHEQGRQAFWLHGPTGSGKSTLTETLCERLEDFTFWAISGCANHENPLCMVPKRKREVLFEAFYSFEGSPCSDCWKCLQNDSHRNRWWEMPVQELRYSLGAACGIAFVEHRVADQNDESFPDEWIQILSEANGGLLVLQCTTEKQPSAFLEFLGEVVYSRRMNTKGSAARISLDVAVIFMANQDVREYKPGDAAFYRRVQECVFPYTVSTRAEKQIVEKLNQYVTQTHHFMPHVEEALNVVVCASRLQDKSSLQAPAILRRLYLYDGKSVENATSTVLPHSRTRKDMRRLHTLDGVKGLSISSALAMRNRAGELCEDGCITIHDALTAVSQQLSAENFLGDADLFPKTFLANSATEVEVNGGKITISELEALVYQRALRLDLVRAWVGLTRFDQKLKDVMEQYLDHAGAYVNKREFIDDKNEAPVDVAFLKRVEKLVGAESADKQETFRREVCQYFSEKTRKGEVVELAELPVFQETLWKHEASAPLAEIRVAFELSPGTRDPIKEQGRIESLKKNLDMMGYKPCCINKLLGDGRTSGYIRRMNLKP